MDDLRPELGAYGRSEIHSPNIDRLASEGLLFERAYVQQAVCSPSRTSLLTGLRPDATQVWDLQTHFRDTVPDVVTLPQHFKQNGYHAEWWGKIYHGSLLDEPSWTKQGQRFEPEGNWRAYVTDEANALADANEGGGPPFERADVPDDAYPDGKIASTRRRGAPAAGAGRPALLPGRGLLQAPPALQRPGEVLGPLRPGHHRAAGVRPRPRGHARDRPHELGRAAGLRRHPAEGRRGPATWPAS